MNTPSAQEQSQRARGQRGKASRPPASTSSKRFRWVRAAAAGMLVVCVAGSVPGQVPVPAQGSSKGRRPGEEIGAAPSPIFEFHSGFWINLHHALYEQARIREQRPTERPTSSSPAANPREKREDPVAAAGATSPEEERAWNEALDYYAAALARRDLQFDGEMVDIQNQLAERENCKDLSGRSAYGCAALLSPELVAALEKAAPSYRARWWAEHDRMNREWIAEVAALVREYGQPMAEQLSTVYRGDWPNGRIRVDVTHYAGLFGGYTSLDPPRVTISGADERNQGLAGLQVLFHEASHTLGGSAREALLREYRQRGKPIPRDLWEAILFYTAGELVKRLPAKKEGPAERKRAEAAMPADRYGLQARGWQSYQAALERHWKPYLNTVTQGVAGPDDFERALSRVVDSL